MSRRITIEFIKSEFEKEGWMCVSTEYIDAHKKLDCICPEGHLGSIRWNDWQQGIRCPVCAGVKKPTIELIKFEFEKEGWVCVSEKYINSYSKLDYVCPKGHVSSIRWSDWQQGCGCSTCAADNKKHTVEFIKSEFEKDNYILTSDVYVNAESKLEYICPEGHVGTITWASWSQGQRCTSCSMEGFSLRLCGSGNPNWKGGISKEPYCQDWTKEYKNYIKERDGHKCMNLCCNSKNPNGLSVHHIDYNKKNCRKKNLITICRGCNSSANFNREFYEVWYQAILTRRYGYTYDKTN